MVIHPRLDPQNEKIRQKFCCDNRKIVTKIKSVCSVNSAVNSVVAMRVVTSHMNNIAHYFLIVNTFILAEFYVHVFDEFQDVMRMGRNYMFNFV